MSQAMRIRFRGCANNLNRSCQKTEQILAKRLACDVPDATSVQQDPIDDIPDDVAEEIMQLTQATMQEYHDHMAATCAAQSKPPQTQNERNNRQRSSAMMERLAAEMQAHAKPNPGPAPDASSSRNANPAAGA